MFNNTIDAGPGSVPRRVHENPPPSRMTRMGYGIMTVMLWAFIALILTLVAVYDILAYPYRQKSGLGVQTLFGVVRR